jgi:hypothetical protein
MMPGIKGTNKAIGIEISSIMIPFTTSPFVKAQKTPKKMLAN